MFPLLTLSQTFYISTSSSWSSFWWSSSFQSSSSSSKSISFSRFPLIDRLVFTRLTRMFPESSIFSLQPAPIWSRWQWGWWGWWGWGWGWQWEWGEDGDEEDKDENEENILVGSSTWDLNSVTFESRMGFSNPFTPILANKSSQDAQIRTHGGVTGV